MANDQRVELRRLEANMEAALQGRKKSPRSQEARARAFREQINEAQRRLGMTEVESDGAVMARRAIDEEDVETGLLATTALRRVYSALETAIRTQDWTAAEEAYAYLEEFSTRWERENWPFA